MMTNPDNSSELEEKIHLLETRIKHLTNELNLVREEHESTSHEYYELLSQMEKKVEERTEQLKELHQILELKGRELQVMLDASLGMVFYKDAEQRLKDGKLEIYYIPGWDKNISIEEHENMAEVLKALKFPSNNYNFEIYPLMDYKETRDILDN